MEMDAKYSVAHGILSFDAPIQVENKTVYVRIKIDLARVAADIGGAVIRSKAGKAIRMSGKIKAQKI
jgi:hypothetical protein